MFDRLSKNFFVKAIIRFFKGNPAKEQETLETQQTPSSTPAENGASDGGQLSPEHVPYEDSGALSPDILGREEDLKKTKAMFLELGKLACNTTSSDEKVQAVIQSYGLLPDCKAAAFAAFSENGEDLVCILRGIEVYGRADDRLGGITISAFGVCAFIRMMSLYVDDDIMRKAFGAFYFMASLTDSRIIEPMAQVLGAGKKRVYTGIEELKKDGFIVNETGPNTPNAGAPSLEENFAVWMIALAESASLDPKDVMHRHDMTEAAKAAEDMENIHNNATRREAENGEDGKTKETDGSDEKQENKAGGKTETANGCEEERQDAENGKTDAGNGSEDGGSSDTAKSHTTQTLENVDIDTEYEAIIYEIDQFEKLAHGFQQGCFYKHNGLDYVTGTLDVLRNQAEAIYGMDHANPGTGKYDPIFPGFKPYFIAMMAQIHDIEKELIKLGTLALGNITEGMSQRERYETLKNTLLIPYVLKSDVDALKEYFAYFVSANKKLLKYEEKYGSSTDGNSAKAASVPKGEALKELVGARYKEVLATIDSYIEQFRSIIGAKKCVLEALAWLKELKGNLEALFADGIPEDDDKCLALLFIVNTISVQSQFWDMSNKKGWSCQTRAKKSAQEMLKKQCQKAIEPLFAPPEVKDGDAKDTENGPRPGSGSDGAGCAEKEGPDAWKEKAGKAIDNAFETWKDLKNRLYLGMNNKRKGSKDRNAAILDAVKLIDSALNDFKAWIGSVTEESILLWKELSIIAKEIWERLKDCINKWYKNSKVITYSETAKRAEQLKNTIHAYIRKSITYAENALSRNSGGPSSHDYSKDNYEGSLIYSWLSSEEPMSHAERTRLFCKFWNEGKDPLDIVTWVDYIMTVSFSDIGDPASDYKCCTLTEDEITKAFLYLTGMKFSESAIRTIVRERMGYRLCQCAKLDQVGEKHPLRDRQFNIILEALKLGREELLKTLILSVDTKAMVILGRLKHDNGLLLTSPDGGVYRVYDHDFHFKLKDFYTEHSPLITSPEMLEREAVLKPVGAYCPTDNTGYVALVLEKDTAESVVDLIRTVIRKKLETTMKEIDKVIILCDGGGANCVNSVLYHYELYRTALEFDVTVELHHYAPGCSKHNPIEHRMFSAISKHWKNKPFLDIEHVMRYINETTTKTTSQPNKLKIECWFENKNYKTAAEKKAAGEEVMDKEGLEKYTKGHITHPYDKSEGDLYKWNVIFSPKSKEDDAA